MGAGARELGTKKSGGGADAAAAALQSGLAIRFKF